jgi:hypothetical protein
MDDCLPGSSFIVDVSFILREDKQIDSIVILSNKTDPEINGKIIEMINSSQKKWTPATTLKYKKTDSRISVQLLFKSPELADLKTLNFGEVGNQILNRAISYHQNTQFKNAEEIFSEYITLYRFTIKNHMFLGIATIENLITNLNNSLINRAAVRFDLGKKDEACEDLKSVYGKLADIKDAQKYIETYCK